MAACLITVSGTSGEVYIKYTLSGNENSITSGIGTVFIDDSATDITYTTLSGDATAASGCVTITELPITCYLFSWESMRPFKTFSDTLQCDAVILGSEVIDINEVDISRVKSWKELGSSIQQLGDVRLVPSSGKYTASDRYSINTYFILKVISTEVPKLRIKNKYEDHILYIEPTVSGDCVPSGYDIFEECIVIILPTTTTTTTAVPTTTTTTTSGTTTTTTTLP